MKGLWCLLLGGTPRWLASITIIAAPSLAIIAEPVLIVWVCMGMEKWTSEKLENCKSKKLGKVEIWFGKLEN